MFKKNFSVKFTPPVSKTKEQIYKEVDQVLAGLGRTEISSSGTISIAGGRFDGFGYTTAFDGRLVDRDGTYTLYLDFEAKPGIIAWIIAICLFPIGLAIFILPYNASGDVQRNTDKMIDDLVYTVEKE
ncbi:MAG: hypothetical protein MK212_10550 [Saprospiraceae bacterium]|nr:hypothetical protein [Saprospiraceae bacterium]